MPKLLTTLVLLSAAIQQPARAGIFDLPAFLEQGRWSIGLEPEVDLNNGTGAGLNVKPRYGITDFLNWEGLIGTGAGARGFRIGSTADFEWFPDYQSQPGVATPLFMDYYRIEQDGLLTFGIKPMIYKTFRGQDASFTPFIGVPLGWNLRNNNVDGFIQVALGTMFHVPEVEHWRFSAEAGFDAKQSYSYISGGATYLH